MTVKKEIEVLPSLCPDHVPYRKWVGDQCVETGILARPGDPEFDASAQTYAQFGPLQENGRHEVLFEVPYQAVRSRPTTPAYRRGWDSTFGKRSN